MAFTTVNHRILLVFFWFLAHVIQHASARLDMGEVVLYKNDNCDDGDNTDSHHFFYGQEPKEVVSAFPDDYNGGNLGCVRFRLLKGTAIILLDHSDHGAETWERRFEQRSVTFVGDDDEHKAKKDDLDDLRVEGSLGYYAFFSFNEKIGYIHTYSNRPFKDVRVTLFPEYFPTGEFVQFKGYTVNDNIESIDFEHLGDLVAVEFCAHKDCHGHRLAALGWSSFYKYEDLDSYGMLDKISGMRWSYKKPVKQSVPKIEITGNDLPYTQDGDTYRFSSVGTNALNTQHEKTFEITNEKVGALEVDIEDSNAFIVTALASWQLSIFEKPVLIMEFEQSMTYTETLSRTTSTETALTISHSQHFVVPPECSYEILVVVIVGKIPRMTVPITATRYYDFKVPGGSLEAATGLWYKTETLYMTISGAVSYDTKIFTKYVPLATS